MIQFIFNISWMPSIASKRTPVTSPRKNICKTASFRMGVVRQLEIIGEASTNLSGEFQEKHSEVPWGQIIGLRNRIVHAYFDINLDVTWDIAQGDIPELKKQIESILF